MKSSFTSKRALFALLVLAGLASLAWWKREPALAWYHVRQLARACQETREDCARKVASLEESALPHVLDGLHNQDPLVCENMQCALDLLAKNWGLADSRSQRLIERLHIQFDEFSPAGKEKCVRLLTGLLQQEGLKPLPPKFSKVISEILIGAERRNELREVSLLLAAELVDGVQPGQWVDIGRDLAERGFKDELPGTRVAAVQLLMREPMRKDKDLVEKAIPLLHDAKPAVRRAALVALAAESDVVREEHFLTLLHDDDAEVQLLCEMALRKRGLKDDDIHLARMITDRNPATRMRVLHYFQTTPELNLSEWLRQLSHDPVPAVRAAAVRAAGDYPHVDLSQRLREMAERDPSETVRQNARYYLQHRLARAARE